MCAILDTTRVTSTADSSVEVVRVAEDRSQGEWFIHHYDASGEPVWREVTADAGESSMTGSSFSD